jgi:hypothetical protein
MIVRKFVSLACVAAAVVSVGACRDRNVDRDRERTERTGERTGEQSYGQTTVTGANVVTNTSAIERVVAARCAREATCKNVGPDKHYASDDACQQKLRSDMRDDLNMKDCPSGIDQKELNECLDSIRKEDCSNPIDAISRLAACRTSDLCLKTR